MKYGVLFNAPGRGSTVCGIVMRAGASLSFILSADLAGEIGVDGVGVSVERAGGVVGAVASVELA